MLFYRLLIIFFISALIGCQPNENSGNNPQLKKLHFTVIHTNDNHGRFWRNARGEMGMAARKTLIDNIRKDVARYGGKVLVLSAGDINTGVPESDIQQAKPDFEGMNMIGYDAMALGNHEFDNPISTLKKQQEWANFPFLSANIFYKETMEPLVPPWEIVTVGDVNIALLGLTTEDTAFLGNKRYTEELYFEDVIDAAKKAVPILKNEHKADIIISLTHIGHYYEAQHGYNAPGDVTLAKNVDGLDIIVGGHSQTRLLRPDIKNSTYILQAMEWGKYVGRADFTYTYLPAKDATKPQQGVLKLNNYRLIPVNLKEQKIVKGKKKWVTIGGEIPEDPDMLAKLKPYQDKASKLLMKPVGQLDKDLPGDRESVRTRPAALGHLIARAQMEKTGADLAVINGGGIRDGLKKGELTEKDLLKVQPFGNMVCYVILTGKELRQYIEELASIPTPSGGFPHFANIGLMMENKKLQKLTIGGEPIKDDKQYKLSINAFSANGGDNWPVLSNRPSYVNTGFTDFIALKEYIKKHSPLTMSTFEPKGDIVIK